MLVKDKKVTNKKQHRCFGCREIIPAKHIMHYWAGINESGDFCAIRHCESCISFYDANLQGIEVCEGWRNDDTTDENGVN